MLSAYTARFVEKKLCTGREVFLVSASEDPIDMHDTGKLHCHTAFHRRYNERELTRFILMMSLCMK